VSRGKAEERKPPQGSLEERKEETTGREIRERNLLSWSGVPEKKKKGAEDADYFLPLSLYYLSATTRKRNRRERRRSKNARVYKRKKKEKNGRGRKIDIFSLSFFQKCALRKGKSGGEGRGKTAITILFYLLSSISSEHSCHQRKNRGRENDLADGKEKRGKRGERFVWPSSISSPLCARNGLEKGGGGISKREGSEGKKEKKREATTSSPISTFFLPRGGDGEKRKKIQRRKGRKPLPLPLLPLSHLTTINEEG